MILEQSLPVEEMSLKLVQSMLHLIGVIPACLGVNRTHQGIFAEELHQLQVLDNQLQMLLCTVPSNAWAIFSWRQNFTSFLTQIIRESQHCLDKLIVSIKPLPVPLVKEFLLLLHQNAIYLNSISQFSK